jgi:SAM-dependent methyltransferase
MVNMPPEANSSGPGLAHFSSLPYQAHNRARLAHLESLGLPLSNRRVLELGSGPGDHTEFYIKRQCEIISVDARQECLDVLKGRYPGVQTVLCDLNEPARLAELGLFDVIHCYGILYHLENPHRLLAYMGGASSGLAIVETCVSPGNTQSMEIAHETLGDYTQSFTGQGCRPARKWLFEELGRFFSFVYHTRTQPNHPEFPIDWNDLSAAPPLVRAVFVASKEPLDLPSLSPTLLDSQQRLDTKTCRAGVNLG